MTIHIDATCEVAKSLSVKREKRDDDTEAVIAHLKIAEVMLDRDQLDEVVGLPIGWSSGTLFDAQGAPYRRLQIGRPRLDLSATGVIRGGRAAATEAKAAEKVEAIETRAAAVVAPIIQREAPKVAGVATREVWRFEVVDPSKINAAFMVPDEQKIRKQVAALKGDAAAIIGPGVRVWAERSIAAGAA